MSSSAAKRRHVRKGTASCWECKRRKTRCTYAAAINEPREGRCDGCRSRGTSCVSQDLDEPAGTAKKNQQRPPTLSSLSPQPLITAIPSTTLYRASTLQSHADISGALAAVFPSKEALGQLLHTKPAVSVLFHGIICQTYNTLFATLDSSCRSKIYDNAVLPPSNASQAHPVLLARRLLLLSKYLQAAGDDSSTCAGPLGESAAARKDMMLAAFRVSTRLVTTDDSLVEGSLDGIECVMMEAMYLNNAGSLRQAWRTNRRAILMAQMMGIHEGSHANKTGLPVLEAATRQRIDPAIMWFRLVATDWYLSLLLGLPPDTCSMSEDPAFARPCILASLSPLEQLERIVTAVAGRLMLRQQSRRDGKGEDEPDRTSQVRKDDFALQNAAKLMPTKWWHSPVSATRHDNNRPSCTTTPCTSELQQTLCIINQFAYYQVLMRLHLPQMLSRSEGEDDSGHDKARFDVYEYSRTVAANAARSILTLFAAFRARSEDASPYCRGVDFVVFGACATLCLAHIETRRRQKLVAAAGIHSSDDALQHQRPSDRGLLEHTLDAMRHTPFVSAGANSTGGEADDVVAQKMACVLQPLLAVEAAVASDEHWDVRLVRDPVAADGGSDNHGTETARAEIPGLGTIVLERTREREAGDRNYESFLGAGLLDLPSSTMADSWDEWALQGVDLAMFSSMAECVFGDPM
ncbi:RNA polymerase II-specific transcription factor-like protein [Microdochium nivale]|nr:RNA polymerase II-specific transcription factor-like protein [Microdochium nivale]